MLNLKMNEQNLFLPYIITYRGVAGHSWGPYDCFM